MSRILSVAQANSLNWCLYVWMCAHIHSSSVLTAETGGAIFRRCSFKSNGFTLK